MFSKLVEAVSKGRGRTARAPDRSRDESDVRDGSTEAAAEHARGDVVVVEAGEAIPGDGRVIEGTALVDESAITGESAPVLRNSGSDGGAVIAGTRVVSGRNIVELRRTR